MPLYEYSCEKCSHHFEELVGSSPARTPACPKCGAADVKRELSVFAVNTSAAPQMSQKCQGCHCAGSGGCPYMEE